MSLSLTRTIVTPVHTVSWINDDGEGRFAVYYYCRGPRRSVSLSAEHDDAEWQPIETIGPRLSNPQTVAVEAAVAHHQRFIKREAANSPSVRRG
ncbi:hypothetical protein [Halalkalirubrum salinum]|uniref:hypothetical protein n=1 Tax=Halalkalirubrum salinum TaxID=2563889 RepID=UPI0010FB4187|nr:hypothetical protein [Halalkalirubrum salinum]